MTTKKTPKKTDALTLRLDPRAKFLIEMMSRVGHQTITGVIEAAVTRSAHNRTIDLAGHESTVSIACEYIWSPVESERVVNTALYAPALLSHEERCIYSILDAGREIFFNIHRVRNDQEFDYRFHDYKSLRGAFLQDENGLPIYITPRKRLIELSWGLIKKLAENLSASGVVFTLTRDEVENYLGRTLDSIKPSIEVPQVVIHDDEGVGYRGADLEDDDIKDSLGIKP